MQKYFSFHSSSGFLWLLVLKSLFLTSKLRIMSLLFKGYIFNIAHCAVCKSCWVQHQTLLFENQKEGKTCCSGGDNLSIKYENVSMYLNTSLTGGWVHIVSSLSSNNPNMPVCTFGSLIVCVCEKISNAISNGRDEDFLAFYFFVLLFSGPLSELS